VLGFCQNEVALVKSLGHFMQNTIRDLPANIQQSLQDFVDLAKNVCANSLISVVLYGSAAEDRLRPTSDVNLMLVLNEFELSEINLLREKLRLYHAAIQLNVMFILETELSSAMEAFAVKFTDILNRHRILFGRNPFTQLSVSRQATITRLKQVIINLILRTRERYALVSLRDEQLVHIIADITGPIRAAAATILSLNGKKEIHPKEALAELTTQFKNTNWAPVLVSMSKAREGQDFSPGEETATIMGLLALLKAMYSHIEGMQ
jgi:hypothetical protein